MIDFIAPIALLLFTLIGPPIKRGGTHAWNGPLHVILPTDATTIGQANHIAGRRAQEVAEWRLIGLLALIPAAVAAWAIGDVIGNVAAAVAWFAAKIPLYKVQTLDDAGHGAEILVAGRDGFDSYRELEADRMLRDPARHHMDLEDVLRQLRRVEWLSKIMVRLAW